MSNPSAGPSRSAAILLVSLLALSLIAALGVYQARTPDLALEVVEIEEEFLRSAQNPSTEIIFFTRFDEPSARISIVGRRQKEMAVLEQGFELRDEQRVRCLWGGLDGEGEEAPFGPYRLRVEAPEEDRDMVFPTKIRLRPGEPDRNSGAVVASSDCEAAG